MKCAQKCLVSVCKYGKIVEICYRENNVFIKDSLQRIVYKCCISFSDLISAYAKLRKVRGCLQG